MDIVTEVCLLKGIMKLNDHHWGEFWIKCFAIVQRYASGTIWRGWSRRCSYSALCELYFYL